MTCFDQDADFQKVNLGMISPLFLHDMITSDILDVSSSLKNDYHPDQKALTSEGGSRS